MTRGPSGEEGRLQPTPHPDVNTALQYLHDAARVVLGAGFQGMYLTGSLALGDFDRRRSDVDYIVVTDVAVTPDQLTGLQGVHARFNAGASPWATEVEAVYFPQDALRRHEPARALHPHIQRGPDEMLHLDELDSGWVVQRHILRTQGVVVAGPPPHTLIDPVTPRELCDAVALSMRGWWAPMVHDAWPLQRPGYQAYAVLTMCRMLYTREHGDVVSKPTAARWAKAALDRRWRPVVDRALAWRKDRPDPFGADTGVTQRLIAYTVERFGR